MPKLMKRIVCFPPHPIHPPRNVQSKCYVLTKTWTPPQTPTFHISILTVCIDFFLNARSWNVNPYPIIFTQKNDNHLQRCTWKTNTSVHSLPLLTLVSIINIRADCVSNWDSDSPRNINSFKKKRSITNGNYILEYQSQRQHTVLKEGFWIL